VPKSAARHFPDRPVRNSIQLPREGLGELLWREVREVFSAGIAQIDVGSVISAHSVKHYSVLPDRAGLENWSTQDRLRSPG